MEDPIKKKTVQDLYKGHQDVENYIYFHVHHIYFIASEFSNNNPFLRVIEIFFFTVIVILLSNSFSSAMF